LLRDPLPPESEWSLALREAMRNADRMHERLIWMMLEIAERYERLARRIENE
jgi:hypothetical protein